MNDNTANNSIKKLDAIREEGNKLLVSYGDRYLHEVEVKGYIGNNGASHDAYHYWLVKDGSGCIDLVVETNASNEVIGHEDNAQINAESIALLGWTGEAREFNADLKDGIDRVKDTVRYLKDEVSYIEDEAKASGCEAYDCEALAHLAEYLEARAAEAEAYLNREQKAIAKAQAITEAADKLDRNPDLFRELDGMLCADPQDMMWHSEGPCACSSDDDDEDIADFFGFDTEHIDFFLGAAKPFNESKRSGFIEAYIMQDEVIYSITHGEYGSYYASLFNGRDYLAYAEDEGQLQEALEAIASL